MSGIDEGGTAFPSKFMIDNGYGFSEVIDTGMTLRDYFAGEALPEAIQDYDRMTRHGAHGMRQPVTPYATTATGSREDIIANQAYRYADAMIRARKVQS